MKKAVFLLMCLTGLMLGFFNAMAQTPDYVKPKNNPIDTVSYYEFRTIEGGSYYGRIVSETPAEITIKSNSGIRVLQQGSIVARAIINGAKGQQEEVNENKTWKRDRFGYQNLFGQTARIMPRGDINIGQNWWAFTGVNAGITDNFQCGGGVLLFMIPTPIYYLTPKYSVDLSSDWKVALGAYIFSFPMNPYSSNANRKFGSLLYSVATYGNDDNNITGGLGYGVANGDVSSSPYFTGNGIVRISDKASLTGEVFLFKFNDNYKTNFGTYNFALRKRPNPRTKIDLGFSILTITDNTTTNRIETAFLPVLSYVYTFTNNGFRKK
jgi:hypothetical protein